MSKGEIGLYKLAKFTNLEIVLESQIQSSGANQSRLIERYKKNKSSIKNQVIAMRFAYGFIFGMVAFLPIIYYFQFNDFINSSPISMEGTLLSGSLTFGLVFGMQLIYLTFMGMFAIGAMMSGEIFQWFETLPISKNKLYKLGFLTILRNLDIAFLMMILSFPIVMGILSQDILLTVASALISIIQVIFAFSILILTAGKISRILKVETIGSKKTTMIRIFTMLAYLIVVMTASLLIQWAVSAMRDFFTVLSSIEISYIFIFLLGMIPFPFAPSFLVTMLLYPGSFPPIQWIPTIIGLIIFVILTTWVYKKAVISMKSITSFSSIEVKQHMEKKLDLSKVESIKVEKISPIKAYIKKDLSMATRDIQMFMFLLMPIIMPLLIVFIFAAIPSEDFGDTLIYLIITWTLLMFYQPLISLMIISGFLNVEDTGASITASLPLNPRQQVKAKLTLLVTIQTISFFLPVIIILILNPEFQPYVLFFISWYPIALVFLFNGFQMKIRMFGRMKYKFVMEEVNPDKKVLKWAIIIVTQFLVFLGYLVIGGLLLIFLNIFIMSIILVTSSLIILALQFISFNIMFPKNFGRKQMISIRESFQKYPIFGTVVILFFYAIFLFLGGLFEIPLIFIGDTIPFTLLLFIDFFISFGLMLLFWLFIVPRVFYLPERTYTKHDFMKTIGIDLRKNLLRNILIGLGCSILFFIISYSAANIFGMQVFDIDVIFGNPNRSIFRFGWFLFITMLIPGIWEEVSFRGVIISLNLKKYSKLTTLIIVSVFFGLFHFLNLLGGQALIPTVIQVYYATFLGGLFGYMFIKTKSLIPSIITHYLINSLGQLFLNAYFSDYASYALFAFFGIGIFPMIAGIILTKLITDLTSRSNR